MKDECEKVELKKEIPEDVSEPKDEQMRDGAESDEQKVETGDDDDEVESDVDDEDVMETTPQMEDSSVVKYSVKTTPYLQR